VLHVSPSLSQVGQLTCQGLAHAYTQCAAVGLNAAPLLAALRKAVRVKLSSMQPADLTAILTALAALGQQDLLYLDEASRWVQAEALREPKPTWSGRHLPRQPRGVMWQGLWSKPWTCCPQGLRVAAQQHALYVLWVP
jgi:hypothetical protein